MTKDQILAALPTLSKGDLKAIQTVIGGFLVNGGSNEAWPPNNQQAWLIEAIWAASGQHTSRVIGRTFKLAFNKNATAALSFMEDSFKPSLDNKVLALGAMRYLLSLLADDLKAKKIPVSPTTLVINLGRLPEVYEAAFPGYIQSGLAGLITNSIFGK